MTTTTMLPLSQLRIDEKSNARHANRGLDPVLLASIKAIGLRTPLSVRANGRGYVVIDGGQRLAALQAIAKEAKADPEIPVIVTAESDAAAREVSLSLNIARTAMHPVDEFRAFASLHTDKEAPLDIASIARRFGVTEKIVAQRLALGSLDETVLKAWQEGVINADTAKVFTLANKKQQAKALAVVLNGNFVNEYNVRQALGIGNNDAGGWINVIGAEAYEARGGKITRDLFGEDHIVSNPELVQTMVNELIASNCERLVAEGWAWAKPDNDIAHDWQYGSVQVEPKPTAAEKKLLKEYQAIYEDESITMEQNDEASGKYDALEAEIKLRSYTPQQKARSGCFVSASPREGIVIEYGRTEPKPQKAEPAKSAAKDDETKKKAKPEDAIPGNLVTRLAEQLTHAAQATLDRQPNVALAALIAGFASGNQACKVTSGAYSPRGASFETAFAAALKLSIADQVKELAKTAARSVNLVLPYSKTPALEDKSFKALSEAIDGKAMNAALREKFDAKDYFASASRSTIVAAVAEAMGKDHAANVAKMDKAAATKFAVAHLPKLKWLPKQLRVSSYDGPISAAKAKAKVAAKAKR